MLENRGELSEEERRALESVNLKGTVSVYKDDPRLAMFVLLAEKGLLRRLEALEHPNSLVVAFTKIDQVPD